MGFCCTQEVTSITVSVYVSIYISIYLRFVFKVYLQSECVLSFLNISRYALARLYACMDVLPEEDEEEQEEEMCIYTYIQRERERERER